MAVTTDTREFIRHKLEVEKLKLEANKMAAEVKALTGIEKIRTVTKDDPIEQTSVSDEYRKWSKGVTGPQITKSNPFGLSEHDDISDAQSGFSYEDWKKKYKGVWPKGTDPVPDDVEEYVTKFWDEKTGEYRYTTSEKTMANKFLPFIVESSTPKHIFKTLISRSKGINNVLVASIFKLTLSVPIKKLRQTVAGMEEMPITHVYEELMQKYHQHRVDEETLSYFRKMPSEFPNNKDEFWDTDLDEFGASSIMTFLYVTSLFEDNNGKYSKYDFRGIHQHSDIFLNFKKFVKFSDDGNKHVFSDYAALKTFILYNAVLRNQIEPDKPKQVINANFIKHTKQEEESA